MIEIYWLEQTERDIPPHDAWLSPAEAARLNEFRVPKRRAEWRLGRWTAKRATAAYLHMPLHDAALATIEIRAASSGEPEVFVNGKVAPATVSLSHRDGLAVCAIAAHGTALGCDLEIVEPRTDAFAADYFLREEQQLVANAPAGERFRLLALLWSAKESALKALHEGLRLDTRSVLAIPSGAIPPGDTQWRALQVRCTDGQTFHGWWQQRGNVIATMVAGPPPALPIAINIGASASAVSARAARQA